MSAPESRGTEVGAAAVEIIDEQHVGAITITRLRYPGADEDPVPAALFRPRESRAPGPAVMIQHGANTSKEDFYVQAPARRWAAEGLTVLAIDLAEHGERVVGESLPPL